MEKEINGIELLKDLYKDISDWLKFAEAKNAALLTFNGVLIFGLLKIDLSGNLIFLSKTISLCAMILCVNIAIILSSFLPSLLQDKKILSIDTSHLRNINKNYLFYGNLKGINIDDFINIIKERYSIEADENDNYIKDLCHQILSVSTIAIKKYNIFKLSICITLLVFFIIFIRVLFYIFL